MQPVPSLMAIGSACHCIKEPVTGATGNLSYGIQVYWNYTRYLFRRHLKVSQGILQAAQVDLEHLRMPVHGIIVTE